MSHAKISHVQEIDITADSLVARLLELPSPRRLALLDSCGVGKPGSNLLIAGIDPIDSLSITHTDPIETLREFETNLADNDLAAIFTIS